MSSLSSISIKRPVLATVMNLIFILIGLIGFSYLGVRDYPSVDPPIITVSTTFTGANADVIETQITEPLESAINGIPGIRSLMSQSRDGRSQITIEFELEVPLETAANDVRDKVSGAMRKLPKDIDPPVVAKADADAQPIYGIYLSSKTKSIIDVSTYADLHIKERLQTIPGVSSVEIYGERRLAIRMKMDPLLLSAYGLTPMNVSDAVNAENVELPSGRVEGESTELTVRTMGRLQNLDDFNNLIISRNGDRVVRFKDVGQATIDAENLRSVMKMNNDPMVGCVILPQPGANYVTIVDRAKEVVQEIEADLPAEYDMGVYMDDTVFIRNSINEVGETIIIAFILVVIIIFLFLRNWRTTLIPIITIPISLIGTFFIMYVCGFTINILTLLAIVLAIGLVVDDAIVVMENIYNKVEQGMPPLEAGFKGSQEIFFAVIATTVALVAVFVPIVFLQGTTGRLFREFSLVIAGAVAISSFVALTFTPMLSTKLLKPNATNNAVYRFTEPFFVGMTSLYERSLTAFMRHRYIAIVIIILTGVVIGWMFKNIPSEMAPLEDRSQLRINSTAPEGASFRYMDNYMSDMVQFLNNEIPETDVCMQFVGRGGQTNSAFCNVMLSLPEDRKRTQQEISEAVSPKIKQFTGARTIVSQRQTFGSKRGGLPVEYVIQAKNLEDLKRVLPAFMAEVSQSPLFSAYDLNLKFTKPELSLSINRDKAGMLGVSVQDISRTLQLTMSDQRVGYYVLNGKQYQIITEFDRLKRNKPSDLANIYVRNNENELISIDNLLQVRENSNPPQLYRYDRFVSATVSASPVSGKTLGQGIDEMDRIADKVLDDNFKTTLSGSSKDFVESSSSLMFAFILALLFIYLVLAAQFESFRDPLIIMFTVPLALVGALLSLWYFGQTMNIFSQIGIIMLIGLVSKNGILIVEFANQRKEQGIAFHQAILGSATARFRPILMTSLSTILGALPMAIASGAGSESRIAMGITVVGGMLFATLLTLYVIPAIYTYLSSSKIKVKNEEISNENEK